MKKILNVLAVSAIVGVGLTAATSCSGNEDPLSGVDVNVHYVNGSTHMGVSYREDTATTGLGGETLQQGKLLPTWSAIGENLNLNIRDAADYSLGVSDEWDYYIQNGFKTSKKRNIDLMMADGSKSAIAANSGLLYSIDELMEKGLLPNFKNWLETTGGGKDGANWSSMKSNDGKVYYTPYFAGKYGTVEKNFMFNVDMVKWLLDDNSSEWSRQPYAASLDTNVTLKESAFAPHIESRQKEKIHVSVDGKKTEIEVDYASNAIEKQNALSTKNGATLVQALKDHIDASYGHLIGEGKTYKTRSEIFTSEAACYNADDLVALMRCVKTNPKYLTGEDTIVVMANRAAAANRQVQILQLASIWGLKGLAGEKEKLYYDKDGKLQDARTDEATYTALNDLHELYNEGMFPSDYYEGLNKDTGSDTYRKTYMLRGQLFMMYDFNAGTTAFNSDANSESKTHDFQACMPPVAKWDAGNCGENTYFHYTEDILALKSGGYCIPKTCDNLEAACKIMDYTWCDEGADLQDYGPNNTYYRNGVTKYDSNGNRQVDNYDATTNPNGGTMSLGGTEFCVMFAKNVSENATFKKGWNDFCRMMIGSTHGVGHQRSAGMDIQTTVSQIGRDSFAKLTSAVSCGVLRTAGEAGSGIFQAVPSNFAINANDTANIDATTSTNNMAAFWKESKNVATYYSYWICNGSDYQAIKDLVGDYNTFKDTFAEVDSIYLSAYRSVVAKM